MQRHLRIFVPTSGEFSSRTAYRASALMHVPEKNAHVGGEEKHHGLCSGNLASAA